MTSLLALPCAKIGALLPPWCAGAGTLVPLVGGVSPLPGPPWARRGPAGAAARGCSEGKVLLGLPFPIASPTWPAAA